MSILGGRTAIVTGAAGGIGSAIAKLFAAEGAEVYATDVSEEAVAQACGCGDPGIRCHALDVTAESDWRRVGERIANERGRLDILVNNAGIACDETLFSMPLDVWRRVMAINCDGVMLGMKHLIPLMTAGGSVINMSSIYGIVGGARHVAYSATKGAVTLMTKSAALECAEAKLNVRVNSLHPGYVETPMFDRMDEARQEANRQKHPLGRVGEAAEIAKAALFLASDGSSFMTGAELVVDGGYTAR